MLFKIIAKLKSLFLYPFQFKHFGKRSRIDKPLRIEGKKYIEIEDRVLVQPYTWLACQPLTGCKRPTLKIGKGCTIGHLNHIYATEGIVFEDYVLTADKVYISDNLHSYENPDVPIMQQAVVQAFTPPTTSSRCALQDASRKCSNKMRIGEGSWLGENVCVIGASVGKHCTIGANAVVTKDIPDYSVAVGIPAKVIKQYNFKTQRWERINNINDG